MDNAQIIRDAVREKAQIITGSTGPYGNMPNWATRKRKARRPS